MTRMFAVGTALALLLASAVAGYHWAVGPSVRPAMAQTQDHDHSAAQKGRAATCSTGSTRTGLPSSRPCRRKPRTAAITSPCCEDEEKAIAPAPSKPKSEAANADRKILYYRNPMGLPDTSPVPKKDWMGMDYIPVYEGEDQGGSSVTVSLDKVQRSGVRTEEARMAKLARPVRAPAIAKPDERTHAHRHAARRCLHREALRQRDRPARHGRRAAVPHLQPADGDGAGRLSGRGPRSHPPWAPGAPSSSCRTSKCRRRCWTRCAAKASPSCRSTGRLRSRAWSWRSRSSKARWRAWVMCCSASPIWPISGSSPTLPSRTSATITIGDPAKVTFQAIPERDLRRPRHLRPA